MKILFNKRIVLIISILFFVLLGSGIVVGAETSGEDINLYGDNPSFLEDAKEQAEKDINQYLNTAPTDIYGKDELSEEAKRRASTYETIIEEEIQNSKIKASSDFRDYKEDSLEDVTGFSNIDENINKVQVKKGTSLWYTWKKDLIVEYKNGLWVDENGNNVDSDLSEALTLDRDRQIEGAKDTKKAVEVSSQKESGTVLNQKKSSGGQQGDFVALEGDFFEKKLGGQEAVKNPSIFFNNLFQFGVYIAGFLATIMIAIGGITYMTTGATDGKKLGREMITSALTGLLIILFSWILLNQINPDLLNLNISNNTSSGGNKSGDIYYKDASIYVGEDEKGFYKVIGEDKDGKEIRIYPYLDSQTGDKINKTLEKNYEKWTIEQPDADKRTEEFKRWQNEFGPSISVSDEQKLVKFFEWKGY